MIRGFAAILGFCWVETDIFTKLNDVVLPNRDLGGEIGGAGILERKGVDNQTSIGIIRIYEHTAIQSNQPIENTSSASKRRTVRLQSSRSEMRRGKLKRCLSFRGIK